MTAIGAMPDELSKVIHDFIRPKEAYEVILEQRCWQGKVNTKNFRSEEDAMKCYQNWVIPEDGEDYELSVHQTYPVVKELANHPVRHCEICAVFLEDMEIQNCCDCNRVVCTDCCNWEYQQSEFHCSHCWNSEEDED